VSCGPVKNGRPHGSSLKLPSARSRSRFCSVAFVSAFPALLLSAPAQADVVWKANFEAGNLSEFNGGFINQTKGTRKNIDVVNDPAEEGKWAATISVHPDDLFGQYVQDRVDMGHNSTLTAEGKDDYLSGYYLMKVDAQVRNEFAFWESNSTSQNVMDFWVEPKTGGGTTVNFGTGFLGATKQWTADFSLNTWHQVAMHVHWSVDKTKGAVSVWFDGVQVLNEIKAATKADSNTLFFQTGLHRKVEEQFTDTIFLDNFLEGTALTDVLAMPPVGGGGSGGSAGVGGSAGLGGSAGVSGSVAVGGAGGSNSAAGSSGSDTAGSGGSIAQGGSAQASGGNPQAGAVGDAAGSASAPLPAPASVDNGGSCALSSRVPAGGTAAALWASIFAGIAFRRRRRGRA
jgi:Polysaccharide lyase